MPSKKIALFVILAIPILLAACQPALESAAVPEPDAFFIEEAMAEAETVAGAPGDFGEDAADRAIEQSAQTVERLVIRNANMAIVIPDPSESVTAISALADELGGFVVSTNQYQTTLESGEEVPRASMTIRVPSDRFNEAISRIESDATQVMSKNESGEDVTQEYTDLQSRLRNLEAAEAQLVVIMEDANRSEDVLNVFNQLTGVREQIEVLKGRIQYLEQSAAFSAISVELIADAAVQPLTVGGWQPGGVAREAIQALINAMRAIANLAIWLVLFVLPVLLVLALPLLVIVWFVRRRRRRKAAEQPME
ncbi:MAG: DUF4349 domain-containing protein [Anaerolineales bacterium]|nr:DUF4349 domain-containing protein [Anaerolineales bacterium]